MDLLFTGGMIFENGRFQQREVVISNGRIVSIFPVSPVSSVSSIFSREKFSVIELHKNQLLTPGFVDVHVHLREPGFSYKETIASGTAAAASGGYTAVCAMPNLNPVPDHLETLQKELEAIQQHARVRVYPYGAITCGEQGKRLANLEALAPYVCGFSDDGRGVQSEKIMRQAMIQAKNFNQVIAAHCEDESFLTPGWCIHDGIFAKRWGFPGNRSESEWRQVERDLHLVRETGCRYHVCHVSTKESVDLIRQAKSEGLPVTCETGPHYLLLCDEDLQDDGRFKMNPPIRSREDRDALIQGLLDGTIDCIATDHAPHSIQEKSGGLRKSLNGVVGLETAFPVLYTGLVQTGKVPLEKILAALCVNPRRIFNLPGGELIEGAPADLAILNLNLETPKRIKPENFYSKGRATPFADWNVSAEIFMTVCDGNIVYQENKNIK